MKIGEGEGEISPSLLGFSEVNFKYFIDLGDNRFAVFPLEQGMILNKGFVLNFDSKWKFI